MLRFLFSLLAGCCASAGTPAAARRTYSRAHGEVPGMRWSRTGTLSEGLRRMVASALPRRLGAKGRTVLSFLLCQTIMFSSLQIAP